MEGVRPGRKCFGGVSGQREARLADDERRWYGGCESSAPRRTHCQDFNPDVEVPMPRLRLLSAGLLTAVLAAAACDGSGEHNVPDEANQGAPGQDSLAAGTATPVAPPPVGTVNPAAPSGPGTYPDSASPTAVGQPTLPAAGGPAQPPTAVEKAGDDDPSTQ
jgi:hypothetical protein